jgi:hypothetical protein
MFNLLSFDTMKKPVKKIIFLLFLFISLFSKVMAADEINRDRWMEVDLFWFERTNMKESSDKFWSRMSPLFEDIAGEKGIIINIGWLMDYLLEWNGDLNSRIPLPKNMRIHFQLQDEGYLMGNTEERLAQAYDRWHNQATDEVVMDYEPWTYKDLKDFIVIFKKSAERKGIKDLKVGTFVLGWKSIYGGDVSEFMARHEQISRPIRFSYFDPTHILSEDNNRFGAYPNGFEAGLPITEFFGNQWGSFSKTIGLDAIVLRDSSLGYAIYERRGPFGLNLSADTAEVNKWYRANADLVRYTKLANPKALVMGYSNSSMAVADARINAMDLEAIAKEGYLDAYIDQTWAGAWNEIAQRPGEFWNNATTGWTYQLGYTLLHGTILSETSTKHYFLTETFDAWESWNIINTVRERLRWGIWAYSHAAVTKPDGYKFPDGSYISWANQAKKLLEEDQVDFLKTETNAAFRDLENIKEIHGPTVVYSRSAMEWQNEHQPEVLIKEWIDEYAASLMKWNVPIMTAARIENLDKIKSDLFIIQTPVHLKTNELAAVNKLIDSNAPVVIIGSPANGIDKSILDKIGFSGTTLPNRPVEYQGTLNGVANDITEGCPNSFLTYQFFTKNELKPEFGGKVIYSIAKSPVMVQKDHLIVWDAPELLVNMNDNPESRSKRVMDEMLGSPVPYVVLSRLLTKELKAEGKFCSTFEEINNPVWCGAWTTKDGDLMVLTGELEEGLDHTGRVYSAFEMTFPARYDGRCMVLDLWNKTTNYVTPDNRMKYALRKSESKLFKIKSLKK